MPVLTLLRHAKAAHAAPSGRDFDRPLAERGRIDAVWAGTILSGLDVDFALVSAACRTRETWERASAEIMPPPALSVEGELYLCSSAMLVTRLRALPPEVRSVVAVGHNPCMQEVALWLARHSGGPSVVAIRDKFPTASLAIFDIEEGWDRLAPERARLRRFTYPKLGD